jgi:predicted transposase YbfD/YdcC
MAQVTNQLFASFSELEDPRIERRKLHKLEDIIILTLLAVISGCNEWQEIELFGRTKIELLRKFCELENGIPSHDTLERLFQRLEPEKFQECFVQWVKTLNLGAGLIAIDGKTLRGTGRGKSAIHLVSAWAVHNQISLGQLKTSEKSNEITAIPELLKIIDLQGAVVSIDAMGTQKEIASQIIAQKGDYLLALKRNHKNLYKEVTDYCNDLINRGEPLAYSSIETGHGRIEERQYWVLPYKQEEWTGLKSIVMVKSSRKQQEQVSTESRFYLSSLVAEGQDLAEYVRGHWGIENNLHWSLDVTFREDESRKRKGHSAQNFALLRKFVLSILKQDSSKSSLKNKRLRAGWDDQFLLHLLSKI